MIDWMSRLTGYISLYGYKFSKEEHVSFIQLAWKLLLTPDMEPGLLNFIARVLIKLLRKTNLLTPEDLGGIKNIYFTNILIRLSVFRTGLATLV